MIPRFSWLNLQWKIENCSMQKQVSREKWKHSIKKQIARCLQSLHRQQQPNLALFYSMDSLNQCKITKHPVTILGSHPSPAASYHGRAYRNISGAGNSPQKVSDSKGGTEIKLVIGDCWRCWKYLATVISQWWPPCQPSDRGKLASLPVRWNRILWLTPSEAWS